MSKLSEQSKLVMNTFFNVSAFDDFEALACIKMLIISRITGNREKVINDLNRTARSILASVFQGKHIDAYMKNDACKELVMIADLLSDELDEMVGTEKVNYLFSKAEELCRVIASFDVARNSNIADDEKVQSANDRAETIAEYESGLARALGLAPLTGSPKQRAWAEKIRNAFIRSRTKNGQMPSASERHLISKEGQTAKYWIDGFKNEFKVL